VEPDSGKLPVNLAYDGVVPLADIIVGLLPGQYECPEINPTSPWQEQALSLKTVGQVDASPVFAGLEPQQTHTLVAAGRAQTTGSLAAFGCADGIVVPSPARENSPVTIQLYLLILFPQGTYDIISEFDLPAGLPDEALALVGELVDLLSDPTSAVSAISKEVAALTGADPAAEEFLLFVASLEDAVNEWTSTNGPDFLPELAAAAGQLDTMAQQLTVLGQATLSPMGAGFLTQWTHTPYALELQWPALCESSPPEDEECATVHLSAQLLADTAYPLELMSAAAAGTLANWNHLSLDHHKLSVNYGRLLLYILNELILPSLSPYNDMEVLAMSLVDCAAVGAMVSAQSLADMGITPSELVTACQTGMSQAAAPLQQSIASLAGEAHLSLFGQAACVDEDDDLKVDRLADGAWQGSMVSGGQEGLDVTGSFQATRSD